MISIFGIVSILIALLSIAAIVLHNQVMNKRAPVDTYLAELEDLLRDRIEILYHTSSQHTELHVLCDQYIDLDMPAMLKALPYIHRAAYDADLHTSTTITQNAEVIQETTAALNQAIEAYNGFITGRPPMAAMAFILGLTTEDPVDPLYEQTKETT